MFGDLSLREQILIISIKMVQNISNPEGRGGNTEKKWQFYGLFNGWYANYTI
jgi:hypothetical protein